MQDGSRLGAADAQDAGQRVWLHLLEHLGNLRDQAALPGWLATTTRRECAHLLRAVHRPQAAALAPDAYNVRDDQAQNAERELLAAERPNAATQNRTLCTRIHLCSAPTSAAQNRQRQQGHG